jgi:hypothetical protein
MSTDVSEMRAASIIMIALMVEKARTSETSVDIQLRTRQYIQEDSELHTRCREIFTSYMMKIVPHRANGFTFPPKEGVLQTFITVKIHRLRRGLNP